MSEINENIVEKVMRAIRKSSTEGGLKIVYPSGKGWKKEYGYDYNTGNYWSQGYGHSGHAITGWHDQQATQYTNDEMKTHIAKNIKKFEKALDTNERQEI